MVAVFDSTWNDLSINNNSDKICARTCRNSSTRHKDNHCFSFVSCWDHFTDALFNLTTLLHYIIVVPFFWPVFASILVMIDPMLLHVISAFYPHVKRINEKSI